MKALFLILRIKELWSGLVLFLLGLGCQGNDECISFGCLVVRSNSLSHSAEFYLGCIPTSSAYA